MPLVDVVVAAAAAAAARDEEGGRAYNQGYGHNSGVVALGLAALRDDCEDRTAGSQPTFASTAQPPAASASPRSGCGGSGSGKLADLKAAKAAAVLAEDYMEAKRLKTEIDALQAAAAAAAFL